MKKRVVVVAPGRGSYTKETLGYLKKYGKEFDTVVEKFDGFKTSQNELTPSELDQASSFKSSVHTKGENASILIYLCSLLDFLHLQQQKDIEIVAVTGNSMGWYTALSLGGALNFESSYSLINTMGSMMKEKLVGGQILYPVVDENWIYSENIERELNHLIEDINKVEDCIAYISIDLGGYKVIAGNQPALSFLMKKLPPVDYFPFQLKNHGAFHTPMMKDISARGFSQLPLNLFQKPNIPMIDGRGYIWRTYSTDLEELRNYTLGHQVVEKYDFTKSVEVALKEFAPDQVYLLGPGNSLGAPLGQMMVSLKWKGISSKNDFKNYQENDPFVVSMGL